MSLYDVIKKPIITESSMLAMDEIHIRNYPESYYKNKENIELNRLDDMLVNQQIQKNIWVKTR